MAVARAPLLLLLLLLIRLVLFFSHHAKSRYAVTGNCNMNAHLRYDGTMDWATPMLEETNYCGPLCPRDGCRV